MPRGGFARALSGIVFVSVFYVFGIGFTGFQEEKRNEVEERENEGKSVNRRTHR